MRTCIMTVVNDRFLFGAITMMRSFRAHNPGFAADFVALTNRENAQLSPEARALLEADVPGVRIIDLPSEPFSRILGFAETVVETPPRLRAALFILEAFRTAEYDRVITLDSDMLVTGDLSRLLAIEAPFAVVRAVDWMTEQPLPFFNTGTMVIRRDHPHAVRFERIEAALDVERVDPNHGKGDQAILNVALRMQPHHVIDERYNFSKRRALRDGIATPAVLAERDVRVLHFLGQKPWNLKTRWSETLYGPLEALWLDAFLAFAGPATRRSFLADRARQAELLLNFIVPAEPTAESRRKENALTRFLEERLHEAQANEVPLEGMAA